MPYPYNNDLGKKVPQVSITELNEQIKKLYEHPSWEKPFADKFMGQLKAAPVSGVFPPWGKPPEPILIPKTQNHPYTAMNVTYDPFAATMPSCEIHTTVYGLGIKHPKFAYKMPLEPWHDYTETEVRKILFETFQKFTEEIINQLKGKK